MSYPPYSKGKKTGRRVPPEARIIGANLRKMRKNAKLSQQAIGQILGASFQQIQKYEQGLNRFPVEKLYRLKHFYQVPYESFFRGMEEGFSDAPDSRDIPIWVRFENLQDDGLKEKLEKIFLILTES